MRANKPPSPLDRTRRVRAGGTLLTSHLARAECLIKPVRFPVRRQNPSVRGSVSNSGVVLVGLGSSSLFTIMGVPVYAFVRGGMLAFATFITTVILLVDVPLTGDFFHWASPPTFVVGLVLAAWCYLALKSVGAIGAETKA